MGTHGVPDDFRLSCLASAHRVLSSHFSFISVQWLSTSRVGLILSVFLVSITFLPTHCPQGYNRRLYIVHMLSYEHQCNTNHGNYIFLTARYYLQLCLKVIISLKLDIYSKEWVLIRLTIYQDNFPVICKSNQSSFSFLTIVSLGS